MKIAICGGISHEQKLIADVCTDVFETHNLKYELKEYISGESFLKDDFPDVLFLEMDSKGELIKDILTVFHSKTCIIFMSNLAERVFESFGRNVYGFLLKPLTKEAVHKVLLSAVEDCYQRKRYIFCKHLQIIEKVYFRDIQYIKAYGRYTKLYVRGERDYMLCDRCIGEWCEELEEMEFAQCHRSYVVNIRYVKNIGKNILLWNGKRIPFSKERKRHVYIKQKIYEEYCRKWIIKWNSMSPYGENTMMSKSLR